MDDQAEKLRQYAAALEQGAPDRRTGTCRVITVTSGKGGVGKSSLTLNMSLSLARAGSRVAVADLDLGLANLDVLLNVLPRYTMSDLLEGTRGLAEVVLSGPFGLQLVPGCSGAFDMANLDPVQTGRLLEKLRLLEKECDFFFFDTGAGLSRHVLDFVRAADEFIVVTTPDPTALTDAYGILKAIARRGGAGKGYIVVNFIRCSRQGEAVFEKLRQVVRRYLPEVEVQYLGGINYDPAVAEAVRNFMPFILSHPGSVAADAVNRIARRHYLDDNATASRPAGLVAFLNRLKIFKTNRNLSGTGAAPARCENKSGVGTQPVS